MAGMRERFIHAACSTVDYHDVCAVSSHQAAKNGFCKVIAKPEPVAVIGIRMNTMMAAG
jgi:hypothetical protein